MADVDVLFAPSFAGSLLLITNNTGHPSLTLRAGFHANGMPHGVTLIGRLFNEGELCRLGMELEQALAVWDVRPPGF
jgi:Asp-tRNA(Asn)/Glu-tRNA(Gln) amidotransferase A subunit family amidase